MSTCLIEPSFNIPNYLYKIWILLLLPFFRYKNQHCLCMGDTTPTKSIQPTSWQIFCSKYKMLYCSKRIIIYYSVTTSSSLVSYLMTRKEGSVLTNFVLRVSPKMFSLLLSKMRSKRRQWILVLRVSPKWRQNIKNIKIFSVSP